MLVHNLASITCFQLRFFRPNMTKKSMGLRLIQRSTGPYLDLGKGPPGKGRERG